MNSKTLIYSIIGIFMVSAGAYVVISPIATRTLDAPTLENFEVPENREEATTVPEVKEGNTKTPVTTKSQTSPASVSEDPAPATPPVVVSGYTSGEVALHSSESSCWSIVNGKVYDLTSYISRHPGGVKNILNICGKDGTSAFEGQHGGESRPEKILAGYEIGPLK